MNYNLITVLGPTAVGKTKLGVRLAKEFNGEIISADSRQVYKNLDIGTGKDLIDYKIDNTNIPFHLIDIVEPSIEYNLFLFVKDFNKAHKKIIGKGKNPILVGGSGLYISSIIQNYNLVEVKDSEKKKRQLKKYSKEELKEILLKDNSLLHNKTDLTDKERIISAILIKNEKKNNVQKQKNISSLNIGVKLERDEIKKKIKIRLKSRLENGMIDEVNGLLNSGLSIEKLKLFGLEYKFVAMYLNGELNYNDMFQKLNSSINSFAKRQMTWFRKMEKEGCNINWVENSDFEEAKKIINDKYFQ